MMPSVAFFYLLMSQKDKHWNCISTRAFTQISLISLCIFNKHFFLTTKIQVTNVKIILTIIFYVKLSSGFSMWHFLCIKKINFYRRKQATLENTHILFFPIKIILTKILIAAKTYGELITCQALFYAPDMY